MSSNAQLVPGDLLLSDLTMKKNTIITKTTPHISYMYTYTHTLGYKIKSLALLKHINFVQYKLA